MEPALLPLAVLVGGAVPLSTGWVGYGWVLGWQSTGCISLSLRWGLLLFWCGARVNGSSCSLLPLQFP
eukprot:4783342-Ditylum_brightwellii.AAC.1